MKELSTENDLLFAKRLREARESKGWRQSALSEASGISAATISAYESYDANKGKRPSLNNAISLAKALGVSLDWMCGLSVKNLKVQLTDFLSIIERYKTAYPEGIFFDSVLPTEETAKVLPSYYESCQMDPMKDDESHEDYLEAKKQAESTPSVAISIKSPALSKFLIGWQKIYQNYIDGIIDDDIYHIWLMKQFNDIDAQQREFDKKLFFDPNTSEGDDS